MTQVQDHRRFLWFILMSGLLHVALTLSFSLDKNLSSDAPISIATEIQLFEKIASISRVGSIQSVTSKPKVIPIQTGEGLQKSETESVSKSADLVEGTSTGKAFVDNYTKELLLLIQSRHVYPRLAQKMKHTGSILVRLRVFKDGSIREAVIVQRSAYQSLNDAAQKLVDSLVKLKPFPENIKEQEWIFNIPIEYKI